MRPYEVATSVKRSSTKRLAYVTEDCPYALTLEEKSFERSLL